MHGIFEPNKTEAKLLGDSKNTFNLISSEALLHNIEYLYQIIVSLQLLSNIWITLSYWRKRIKITRINQHTGNQQQWQFTP